MSIEHLNVFNGKPNTTPKAHGLHGLDLVNYRNYISAGTQSPDDWLFVNAGLGNKRLERWIVTNDDLLIGSINPAMYLGSTILFTSEEALNYTGFKYVMELTNFAEGFGDKIFMFDEEWFGYEINVINTTNVPIMFTSQTGTIDVSNPDSREMNTNCHIKPNGKVTLKLLSYDKDDDPGGKWIMFGHLELDEGETGTPLQEVPTN